MRTENRAADPTSSVRLAEQRRALRFHTSKFNVIELCRVIPHPESWSVSPSSTQINGGVLMHKTHRLLTSSTGSPGSCGQTLKLQYIWQKHTMTLWFFVPLVKIGQYWTQTRTPRNPGRHHRGQNYKLTSLQRPSVWAECSFKTNVAEFQLTLIFTRAASTPPGCPAMDTCSQ